tara:strand:+ start:335 stop:538 length:204 start_codon:yes stop_codon:yes gene_type:complete
MFFIGAKESSLAILPTRVLAGTYKPRFNSHMICEGVFNTSKFMLINLDPGVSIFPRSLQIIDSDLLV